MYGLNNSQKFVDFRDVLMAFIENGRGLGHVNIVYNCCMLNMNVSY